MLGVEVRVVAVDPRAGGEQLVAQAEGGAEGVLAHVAAVRDAEHQHRLAVERADAILDHVDGEGAHALVDLARQRRNAQLGVVVEQEVRVDRDAVPADPDARLVDVAVRLRVRRVDDLGHVDPVPRGVARQLVGVGDVHVAVRRLGQLGHLGRLGAGHGPHLGALVEDGAVEVHRTPRALVARAADDLRVAAQVEQGRGRRARARG